MLTWVQAWTGLQARTRLQAHGVLVVGVRVAGLQEARKHLPESAYLKAPSMRPPSKSIFAERSELWA